MLNKSFIDNGCLILKNCISKNVIKEIQKEILASIFEINKKKKINSINKNEYYKFCQSIKKGKTIKEKNIFQIVELIHKRLVYKNIFKKLFNEKKVNKTLIDLMGKDLAFLDQPSTVVNFPKDHLSQSNYYFKDWHQELWSGADISSIITWTPIFQKTTKGQLQIIKGSHNWGHIPHKNRKPISLPEKFKITEIHLKPGDMAIMHNLVVHRSVELISKSFYPRLAIPCMVKNFKIQNNSFENNKSWKIFSYSEFTHIERKLGNVYLSPFRTIDITTSDLSKGSY